MEEEEGKSQWSEEERYGKQGDDEAVGLETEQEEEVQGTFVTQVVPEKRRASIRSGPLTVAPSSSAKVSKVEEESLEWVFDTEALEKNVPALPKRIDTHVVVNAVADSLCFNSLRARTSWRRVFCKPGSMKFISAAFWWLFLEYFTVHLGEDAKKKASRASIGAGFPVSLQKIDYKDAEKAQSLLFDHLATAFFNLFFTMNPKRKDRFFNVYPDCVSQCIFQFYTVAFPASKLVFDQTFKEEVIRMVGYWIHGTTAPKTADISHWGVEAEKRGKGSLRRIMFNLETGDGGRNALPGLQGHHGAAGRKHKQLAAMNGKEEKHDPVNLVNVKSTTVHVTKEISNSPLVEYLLHGSTPRQQPGSKDKYKFRMTQSTRVYKSIPPDFYELEAKTGAGGAGGGRLLLADTPGSPKQQQHARKLVGNGQLVKLSGEDKSKDGEDSDDEDVEEDEDLDEEDLLDKFSKETYRDVIHRAEEQRKGLMKKFEEQRKSLSKDLKSVQRVARKQVKELEENKRRAIKGDIHELSNYLVSMWKVDDE